MSRSILVTLLLIALVCAACHRKRVAEPIDTTAPAATAPAHAAPPEATPSYAAPPEAMPSHTAPPEAMPSHTAPPEDMAVPAETEDVLPDEVEGELSPLPEDTATDTTPETAPETISETMIGATPETALETEVAATSEEAAATGELWTVAGGAGDTGGFKCILGICLGMSVEEVGGVVGSGALNRGGKTDCRQRSMREVRLAVPAPGVKRFIYNNICGGLIDHAEFRFHEEKLILYYVYFSRNYLKDVKLHVFIEEFKGRFGDPVREVWQRKNELGLMEWESGNLKATLKVQGKKPYLFKIEDVEAGKSIVSKQEDSEKEEGKKRVEELLP